MDPIPSLQPAIGKPKPRITTANGMENRGLTQMDEDIMRSAKAENRDAPHAPLKTNAAKIPLGRIEMGPTL